MDNPNARPIVAAAIIALLLAIGVWVFLGFTPSPSASLRIRVVALSASGRWLAGGAAPGGIHVRRLDKPTVSGGIAASSGDLNDLRFSPDERRLAIADRNLTLVPLAHAGETVSLRNDEANYGTVRFSTDGQSLLTVNGKGAISHIDLHTGAVQPGHCCTSIWGEVAFTPDETSVLWAGHWPGVWDLRSGTLAGRFNLKTAVAR